MGQTLQYFFLTVPRRCFFCGSFLLCMFHVCLYYAVLSVPCILVITCFESTSLFSCVLCFPVFCHFPKSVPGQAWYLIVSIPNRCKKCDKDQESIQSGTTPDPGYHKHTIKHHKQGPRGSPFPAGDHKAAMNRHESMKNTRHK